MQAVILGAGEGSRMGNLTGDKPKLFLEVDGKPIYKHQISKLTPYCDKIYVAVGYGFDDGIRPEDAFDTTEFDIEIEFVVVDKWKEYENSYTAMKALQNVDDNVILVCGDVIFSDEVINSLVDKFAKGSGNKNVVGAIDGIQNEMTAVTTDIDGIVTQYGAIEGHQEVGIFILDESNILSAVDNLEQNLNYWFPVIFEKLTSEVVFVDRNERFEINTPDHLKSVQNADMWN